MTQDNGTGGAGTGRLRASDAEREGAVEQLRDHFEAGRLDPEEFGERMEAALAARFVDELPPLLADLPSGRTGAEPPRAGASQPSGPRPGWDGRPWLLPGFAGPRAWRSGPFPRFLPLLAVLAVVASIGAVAHGHFPFPLLWLGVAIWWFRPWTRHRHSGPGRRFTSSPTAPRS